MSLKFKISLAIFLIMVIVMCLITMNIKLYSKFLFQTKDKENRELVAAMLEDALSEFLFREGQTDPNRLRERLRNMSPLESWVIVDEERRVLYWDREYIPLQVKATPETGFEIPVRDIGARHDVDLIEEAIESRSMQMSEGCVAIPLYGVVPGDAGNREVFWVLFARMASGQDAAVRQEGRFLWVLYWQMVLGTVLLLVVVYILMNRFVLRPIDSMIGEFRRVAAGDYAHPVAPVGRIMEFDRMVRAFEVMREKVRSHHEELRQRIEETTILVKRREHDLMLAQRVNAVSGLAAGLAHEINNPLGGVMNAVRSLERSAGAGAGAKEREYLELIQDGLRRIEEIVQRILVVGARAGKERFRWDEVAGQAWQLMQFKQPSSIVFSAEIHPTDLSFDGSPGELLQVLMNLFSNSIDAMPRGGTLVVRVRREGREQCVEVVDTGIGMTEEQKAAMFDYFYTTKPPGKGTGLGMPVVYAIITGYGGTITVESTPNQGTTVRLRLPCADA